MAALVALAAACGSTQTSAPPPEELDATGVAQALGTAGALATFQFSVTEPDGAVGQGGGYLNASDSFVRVEYLERPQLSELNATTVGGETLVRYDRQLSEGDMSGLDGRTWYRFDVPPDPTLPEVGQKLSPATAATFLTAFGFASAPLAVTLAGPPNIDAMLATYELELAAPAGPTKVTVAFDGNEVVRTLEATAADGRKLSYSADVSRAERIVAPPKPESMGSTLAAQLPEMAQRALPPLAQLVELDQASLDGVAERVGFGPFRLTAASGRQVSISVLGVPEYSQCLTVPPRGGATDEVQLVPGACAS